MVAALCPWASHFIPCLVLIQSRKTGNRPDMTEKLLTGASVINTDTQYQEIWMCCYKLFTHLQIRIHQSFYQSYKTFCWRNTWFVTSSYSTLWPRPYWSLYPLRWYNFHQICVYLKGMHNMISDWVVLFAVDLVTKAMYALLSGKSKHFDINGRFTFERIHSAKEQILFYEWAEKH